MYFDTLKGNFLLSSSLGNATPGIFKGAVVYILEHDDSGTYGVIVNKVVPNSSCLLPGALGLKGYKESSSLFLGGPLSMKRLQVLFVQNNKVTISSSKRVIEDNFIRGDSGLSKFVVGYSSWGPGQVYDEIERHLWHLVPADKKYIFSNHCFVNDLKNDYGLSDAFMAPVCGNS